MLTFAISVLHEYPLIWSGDTSLVQPVYPPEVERMADEPDDAFGARKVARDGEVAKLRSDFEAAYVRAVETGDWSAIRRHAGPPPTVFRCRPIPGPLWRQFLDHIAKEDNDVGGFQQPALAFRLAVVGIDNFLVGHKVERLEHLDKRGDRSGLGLVLSDDVIKALDDIDPMIVTILGYASIKHRSGPHPL